MNRFVLFLCLLPAAIGCVKEGHKSENDKPVINSGGITKMAYEACQKRDHEAGVKIQQLAKDIESGKVDYDKPIMESLVEINSEVTKKHFGPVEAKLREAFDAKAARPDKKKVAKALAEFGQGRIEAGGGSK